MKIEILSGILWRLLRDEEGSFTTFGLYITAGMAIVGGIAVDYQNALTARTQLQVTADTVAHAALYNREVMGPDEARTAALALVASTQPEDSYGTVLTSEDILFGTWSYKDMAFTVDDTSSQAVMVSTARLADRGNAVSTFLMKFIGLGSLDVVTNAVYVTYKPACLREGFVAEDIVDIQSNNAFYNGFCIHSNTHVSVNSNNFFEPGSVVSMPDTTLLDLPKSGFETNDGLRDALRNGYYRIRILNRIEEEIKGIMTYGSATMPTYITTPTINYVSGRNIDISQLQQNAYNIVSCSGNGVTFRPDVPMRNMVVKTACEITFGNGTVLEDAIVIGTSPNMGSSIKGSHVQVGRNDSCATGGGAILLSMGGMSFASDLKAYGGQLIAVGDIEFAANADGIEGASFISGRTISGTSNMTMGFCDGGMEHTLQAPYFRLAH